MFLLTTKKRVHSRQTAFIPVKQRLQREHIHEFQLSHEGVSEVSEQAREQSERSEAERCEASERSERCE